MESEFKVAVLCLFCHAPLEAEEGAVFESGELIMCKLCGELSDYDSVIEVAKEKAVEKVKLEVQASLKKLFK